jgi:hypothetical protein
MALNISGEEADVRKYELGVLGQVPLQDGIIDNRNVQHVDRIGCGVWGLFLW